MSRLIDADALDKTLEFYAAAYSPIDGKRQCLIYKIIQLCRKRVQGAPTVNVEHIEKRGEWINVKERLPEYNPAEPAKAYFVAYDTNKGKHIQIAIYSDHFLTTITELPSCVTWRDYENHKIKNVTHWMPLPEPPQEDKP